MKHQVDDFKINENNIPIFINNTFAICLNKNPSLHSISNHIDIKHHFIIDYVHKGILDIKFVDSNKQ